VTRKGREGDEFAERRAFMVEHHLRRRGIRDERVLRAFLSVRREEFVPPEWRYAAYADHPLPIGEGQTISQPYIVALMTEELKLSGGERVLEIGTGSGYQTAILAELEADIWTIERSAALSRAAQERLHRLGYRGIRFVVGDGTIGLPAEAPFDRIIATGSFPSIPTGLLAQLREGGIFVGPVGDLYDQRLIKVGYHPPRFIRKDLGACRFVPLIGRSGWRTDR